MRRLTLIALALIALVALSGAVVTPPRVTGGAAACSAAENPTST